MNAIAETTRPFSLPPDAWARMEMLDNLHDRKGYTEDDESVKEPPTDALIERSFFYEQDNGHDQ